jgi:hypothetical protein
MTNSTHFGLPYLDAAQAQKHVTHNDALRMLDALVQLSVTARNLTSVPAAPAEGGRWLVGSGATGVFAGNANNVAAFQDGVWRFFVPQKGWCAFVETEAIVLVFDGAAWNNIGLSVRTLQNLAELGIGTTADTTNVLAAKLNSALFTAKAASEGGTGDLRCTLNKSAASNTVSQLYQDAFSGRAEVGLTGDDNFHFKVSPDGSTWYDALILSSAAGDKFAPAGGLVLGNSAFFSTTSASGAVTPTSQVQGTGGSAAFLAARFSNDTNGSRVFFAKSRGASVGAQGAIATADDLGGMSFSGSDGAAMRHGASLRAIATGAATANGTPTKLVISTSDGTAAPVDRAVIDQAGNLGIGTTAPAAKVTVSTNISPLIAPIAGTVAQFGGADSSPARFSLDGYGSFPQILVRRYNGSAAAPSAVNANDVLFNFNASPYDGAATAGGAAAMNFVAGEAFSSTAHGTYIIFNTTANGSATNAERVRFDGAGNVQMGGANTVLDANRLYNARSYTVAALPTPGVAGRVAFASNGRMYNGAGTLESAGAGTGGLVCDNGTAWKIVGTNQIVQA